MSKLEEESNFLHLYVYKLGFELFQIGFDVNSSEKVVDEVPGGEERDAETESQTAPKFGHKGYRGVDLVIKTR